MIQHSENIGTLAARLARVLANVRRVPQSGRNTYDGYQYATEADLLDEVRPLLAAEGISVATSYDVIEERELGTNKGKTQRLVRVRLQVMLADADGAWVVTDHIGEGADRGDKAVYKAVTGAAKYWAMKTFLIATGDEPERDAGANPTDGGPAGHAWSRQQEPDAVPSAPAPMPERSTADPGLKTAAEQWVAKFSGAYGLEAEAVRQRLRDAVRTIGGPVTVDKINKAADSMAAALYAEATEDGQADRFATQLDAVQSLARQL